MDLNDFAVNPSTYEDGVTVALSDTAHVRLRSAGSRAAQKVRERLWKPYASWKNVPDEVREKVNADWLAQGIIVELVGVKLDGKELKLDLGKPADQAKLAAVLAEPRFKPFATRLLAMALDETQFAAAADKAAEGN